MTAKQTRSTNPKQRKLIVLAAGCLSFMLAVIGMFATGTEVAGFVSAIGLIVVFGSRWLVRSIGHLWGQWKRQREQVVFPGDGQPLLLTMGKSMQ